MILIQHGDLPVAFNPAHIELVIDNNDYGLIYMINKRETLTEVKYSKIKASLPDYFIEIKSPNRLTKSVNFKAMINTKLISQIGWNKTFCKEQYENRNLLIYDMNVPKNLRWSEDRINDHLDFIGVFMFSGAYIPVLSGVIEMVAAVQKKTINEVKENVL